MCVLSEQTVRAESTHFLNGRVARWRVLLDRRTPVAKNAPVAIRGVFLNATDKRELASGETVFSEGDPGMAPTCMP